LFAQFDGMLRLVTGQLFRLSLLELPFCTLGEFGCTLAEIGVRFRLRAYLKQKIVERRPAGIASPLHGLDFAFSPSSTERRSLSNIAAAKRL
jgi:hypothetical protein